MSYQLHLTKCTSANDLNEWKVIHFHTKLTNGCSYFVIWKAGIKKFFYITCYRNLYLKYITWQIYMKQNISKRNKVLNRFYTYSILNNLKLYITHSMPVSLWINHKCAQFVTKTVTSRSYNFAWDWTLPMPNTKGLVQNM